ncbi:MAG: phosphoglycerate kinase [Candidatus Taylorbacteria bacterium RIFCSPHIGHO2_02_FULL_45_35]|uniref:Phosphoglycerate kinase n=1 Tax=Candidatus Taylorbacteria bacterium RIFCSPHIGHO2_02_FULL_45_35 TaxID=1802311 RepID=A0A1G2MP84_9BACT|nr:MAG: phosphoglycerate kinase [Candidatus Taylorbacteria bacterium RIFCSPHIGHO2_02_FULL_45_35]OHA33986.1 MAG: phosphoglycerate kinase [Candidatus Taylorbacteria bacterium RIFCSPLOWO2_01_FULL_45_34b]QBM02333.1 phosphoglycerate kinase [uncultured archaeon]
MTFPCLSREKIISGTRVLLRLDLNVPIKEGKVTDDFRILRSMKTLEFLVSSGARTVIVAHIDDKEGGTLLPVFEYLKKKFKIEFSSFKEAGRKAAGLTPGSFLFIENIRENEGEVENDEAFAKELSMFGSLYINEAFSVSHRPHASIVGVPKFLPSYAGFLFEEEVRVLSEVFNPPRPFLFILGGAKFETKIPLIQKFLKLADHCFVGGALANDFFKVKGFEVGTSRLSEAVIDLSLILSHPKLSIPSDVVVKSDGGKSIKKPEEVKSTDVIFDAGPKTVEDIKKLILQSKFVLWNGPLGNYENGFASGTEALACAVSESKCRSIVGGGDTLAVISKLGILDKFSFVSTGGGAMLDFLADETLPGVIALEKSVG